jgi:2-hydroxy-6-oxonona-2,4-dienedioate hydrolase
MNDESSLVRSTPPGLDQDPAAMVAAVEKKATRHETPCGDGHMVWRRWGSGPPVVLIHGGSGAWSHWIRNIEALSARYTVWAIDLPGCGESAMPDQLTVETLADIVERGLLRLMPGSDPVDLVAFSFGSPIATMLAVRLKKRTGNLILLGGRFARYSPRLKLHMMKWRTIADPAECREAHRHNLAQLMIDDPKNIDALAVYIQSTNAPRTRISARKWTPGTSDKLHEYFPQVVARQVIVAFGRRDMGAAKIIENGGADLRSDKPGVKLQVFENAGHWVQYEAADEVNEFLLAELAAKI